MFLLTCFYILKNLLLPSNRFFIKYNNIYFDTETVVSTADESTLHESTTTIVESVGVNATAGVVFVPHDVHTKTIVNAIKANTFFIIQLIYFLFLYIMLYRKLNILFIFK